MRRLREADSVCISLSSVGSVVVILLSKGFLIRKLLNSKRRTCRGALAKEWVLTRSNA